MVMLTHIFEIFDRRLAVLSLIQKEWMNIAYLARSGDKVGDVLLKMAEWILEWCEFS